MTEDEMLSWLRTQEGYSPKPYDDTVGVLTIGYGNNLEEGISRDEAELMLKNDLNQAYRDVAKFPWIDEQPEGIKDALVNMCFNMGLTRLKGFKKMLLAIERHDYTAAAMEALNSKWAAQVGQRAKDIAVMIREAK